MSQIQDIVGCRVLVEDCQEQSLVVLALTDIFRETRIVSRLAESSHGYRAVHVIAIISGHAVELQVRTHLQHRWAQLSEKYSDIVDPAIKYGGGPSDIQDLLRRLSSDIAAVEGVENLQSDLLGFVSLIDIQEFRDSERTEAEHARIELELSLNRAKVEHEVALFQAQSLEELRTTHNRYFADVRELISDLASSTSTYVVRERRQK